MNIKNGDKFIAIKKMWLINEGGIVTVTNVGEDNMVSFTFGEHANGYMDFATFEKCFKKLEFKKETNNTPIVEIDYDYVDTIMQNSEFDIQTVFDKFVIVSCKLPNGFVIVEAEPCSNTDEYEEECVDICLDKIANKIVELETYRIQEEIYRARCCECSDCDCDECNGCNEDDDNFVEEVDCEDCHDYQCEHHPFNVRNLAMRHPLS